MDSENAIASIVEDENLFTPSIIPLSQGLLGLFKPSLEKCRTHLNELNSRQSTIVKQIEDENKELSKIHQSVILQDLFKTIGVCQNKLVTIRKDMKLLYEKSSKLKKLALKLQKISMDRISN